MADHIYTYTNPCSERDLARACRTLEDDGLLAYPTDVNWAIGCDSSSPKAISRIRALKPGHPKSQPFSLICSSFSMISQFADIAPSSYRILRRVLPGPYTVLLKRNKRLPKQIKDKRTVVGIRYPNMPLLLELVERLGRPILNTSLPSPPNSRAEDLRFGYEVDECLGHALDLILDLGEELAYQETSVVDFSDGLQVVREGVGPVDIFEDFG